MKWCLVHTKPRQEKCAQDNLRLQDYQCYLPTIPTEKLCKGLLTIVAEPLFPRYLFINLGQGDSAKTWSPIRSTKGVSRLVSFGNEPASVDNFLIESLQRYEASLQSNPERLFKQGDCVRLMEGPFTDIECIYQMDDGERRVMVLIDILNKPVIMHVSPANLRKIS